LAAVTCHLSSGRLPLVARPESAALKTWTLPRLEDDAWYLSEAGSDLDFFSGLLVWNKAEVLFVVNSCASGTCFAFDGAALDINAVPFSQELSI
jgi:hypothetical protein